jgi:hypothetical protein
MGLIQIRTFYASIHIFRPGAGRSKAWVCGRLLAGIVGSNSARACECCVSGRGLCVGLIPRPEVSYRVWCV